VTTDRTITARIDLDTLPTMFAESLGDWLRSLGATPADRISPSAILHQARNLATLVGAQEVGSPDADEQARRS
jgi:hypothetical protein